jgi:hypothetical protein
MQQNCGDVMPHRLGMRIPRATASSQRRAARLSGCAVSHAGLKRWRAVIYRQSSAHDTRLRRSQVAVLCSVAVSAANSTEATSTYAKCWVMSLASE